MLGAFEFILNVFIFWEITLNIGCAPLALILNRFGDSKVNVYLFSQRALTAVLC